jgi:hypothetical protein
VRRDFHYSVPIGSVVSISRTVILSDRFRRHAVRNYHPNFQGGNQVAIQSMQRREMKKRKSIGVRMPA